MRDYAELARLGHVSAARISQIMILLHLSPAIQEYVLFSLLIRLGSSRNRSCEPLPASYAGITNVHVWRD